MLRILQVNTADLRGGAETVARNLHRAYRHQGHESWIAVGYKHTDDPYVLAIPPAGAETRWIRGWRGFGETLSALDGKVKGLKWLGGKVRVVGEPQHFFAWWQGVEDFHFDGTQLLLDLPPTRPDIFHLHNLHGRYFDLRVLPRLSQEVPAVLTLHDAWALSGHCGHSFDCERWKTGCGRCPDLSIYPAVRRDATASNWQRKLEIYSKSRLYVATPSRWLMRKVEQSILASGIFDSRIIPNGVDMSVFHPGDKNEARAGLGIPHDARMLLFAANGIQRNRWKDYNTIRSAVALVAARLRGEQIVFVALGEGGPPQHIGSAEVRFVPYQDDRHTVARYYQAADIYVHAARAEVFGNTIVEAMACGTPVVATAVGGIPEVVEDSRTGYLVPPGNPESMAQAIEPLLLDESLQRNFGAEAAKEASGRFSLEAQAEAYLKWYEEILGKFGGPSLPRGG